MPTVTWVDRAQSTDGYFDLNAGYVLCEIDGETYAVSGRYAGIPDAEEAQAIVCALHEERYPVGYDRYEYEVTVVCKRKRCVKATGYAFKRFDPRGSEGKPHAWVDPCADCRCYRCECGA